MKRTGKKALILFVLILILAGAFGCATTTPTLGVGYHPPVTAHDRAGTGFGIGF
jgi:hypothetical protein